MLSSAIIIGVSTLVSIGYAIYRDMKSDKKTEKKINKVTERLAEGSKTAQEIIDEVKKIKK